MVSLNYIRISKYFSSQCIVVYNDASRRPDPSGFTKLELWHSDVTILPISYQCHDK
jgi:hypothetical protein